MSQPLLSCRAIIVQPLKVNFHFRHCAERLARALTLAGAEATLASLDELPSGRFDVGFAVSLAGLSHHVGGDERFLSLLSGLQKRCGHLASVNLEPMQTRWFEAEIQLFRRLGLRHLLDMNVAPQHDALNRQDFEYVFLKYGLLPEEREALNSQLRNATPRPIPWAFVGIATPERVRLARSLVCDVNPQGFLYLSEIAAITDDGRHLGAEQLKRVLAATEYYVWRSQNRYFYLEGERFRWAALCGCAPVKVVDERPKKQGLPFTTSIVLAPEIIEALRSEKALERRREFVSEYLLWPGLEELVVETVHDITSQRSARRPRPRAA